MPTALGTAVEVALEWGIPAVLTGVGAWAAVKWRAIRNWARASKHRKAATAAMVDSWPTALEFISGAKLREDQSAAREIRVTAEFASLREHLSRQDESIATILANTWAEMRMSPVARFECDSTGRNRDVNPAYAELMRVDEKQLQGYGYKNYFRDPVFHAAFMQCVAEHRHFDETTEVVRGDGTRFIARVIARPFPEDPAKGPALRWYGSVAVVEEIERD